MWRRMHGLEESLHRGIEKARETKGSSASGSYHSRGGSEERDAESVFYLKAF